MWQIWYMWAKHCQAHSKTSHLFGNGSDEIIYTTYGFMEMTWGWFMTLFLQRDTICSIGSEWFPQLTYDFSYMILIDLDIRIY